jgi:hypothetical protein
MWFLGRAKVSGEQEVAGPCGEVLVVNLAHAMDPGQKVGLVLFLADIEATFRTSPRKREPWGSRDYLPATVDLALTPSKNFVKMHL